MDRNASPYLVSIRFVRNIALFIAIFVTPFASTLVLAQSSGGSLSGSVTDPSDAKIVEGRVAITNVDTGVITTVTTNRAGTYFSPNLLPGKYVVDVSALGFGTKHLSGVTIAVGTAQVLDVTLDVSAKEEQVVVPANVEDLQFATSDISAFIGGETIRDLPLNGRSWFDLAVLQPGVAAIQAQRSFAIGTDRGTRGFGSQLTVSGARPQQNNYLLNGTSLNDYANDSGSVIGGNLGVDAISEFTVITSNASAEYGRSAGGIINAVTRSGTNTFHGSGYEFARNSTFDARNFFDGAAIPYFSRNQFGATVGGPIKSNRTFFFANYEGIRQTQGNSGVATVPTADARKGILHDANGSTTTVTVDPSAAKYLTFWPLPNGGLAPGGNGDIGIYNFSEPQVVREDYVVGRVDHRVSQNDSIFATYLYDRTPYTYPDSLNDIFFLSKTSKQIATVEETHTFSPTIVNTFRLGLNRNFVINNVGAQAINPAVLDASLAAVPGQYAAQVSVPGWTGFTGGSGATGSDYAWTSYQLGEDIFLNRGKHSIKSGFAFELMRLNVLNHNTLDGQFVFTSVKGFLTNQPFVYSAPSAGTISPRNLQEMLFGGYAQDNWRVNSNLTLNLGLRYEAATVVRDAGGKLSNLVNISDPTPQLGNPFFNNPTTLNFEPRAGFALSPFAGSKTVLRGAFGIYDVLPLPYEFILPATFAAPFTKYGIVEGTLPAGTFYSGAGAYLNPYTLFGTHVQKSPKRNYVMQWNLNVERQLTSNMTLLVAYVGSRGVHQPYYSNQYNIVLPTVNAQGNFQWPLPIGSGKILNPNYGTIRGLDWIGDSYYHGFQVGLRSSMKRGLQFQVSYTQSRSIDDTSSSLAADAFGNSVSTLPFFSPARGRGPSDFNQSRVLVINGIAELPQLHGHQPVVTWLTKGWQLGTILMASDGIPFTPIFGSAGDPLGSNGLQDYPDRLGGPGCSSLINPRNYLNYVKTQCFAVPVQGVMGNAGRNILIGPGLLDLDTSVFKTVQIPKAGDRVKVQFRAEFFNVLNHTNYAIPGDTDIFNPDGTPSATAGLITSTTTPSRQIQFGVKGTF